MLTYLFQYVYICIGLIVFFYPDTHMYLCIIVLLLLYGTITMFVIIIINASFKSQKAQGDHRPQY